MVRRLERKSFLRDEQGISFVEAMLVFPILLLVITAMVELGVAMFQWNQSVKAIQIGARLLAVSSPVVGDTRYLELTNDYGTIPSGDPTPSGPKAVSCGADSVPCDTTRLNRVVYGGDNECGGTIGPLVGICDVAPWISPANVRVTYERSGLGYVGRPSGPVSTVVVEIRNVNFDFFILDAVIDPLVPGAPLSGIAIPAHPVAITSEDLNDCIGTCP